MPSQAQARLTRVENTQVSIDRVLSAYPADAISLDETDGFNGLFRLEV